MELQSADFVDDLLQQSRLIENLTLDIINTEETKKIFMKRVRIAIEQTDMCHHFSMVSKMSEIVQQQNDSFNISSHSIPNTNSENFDLEKLLKQSHQLSRTMLHNTSLASMDSFQQSSVPKLRLLGPGDLDSVLNTILHAAGCHN